MSEQNINDLLSGGGFSSLLQNPDIAAKLPRIMEALKPVMEEMRAEQGGAPPTDAAANVSAESAEPSAASASASPFAALPVGGGGGKQRTGSARRCALLKALEPYLSDNRREAMEYIIKVSSLIDILSEVM